MKLPISFELERYTDLPAVYPAPDYRAPGVKSLIFRNEDHFGKETRVFGWTGMPYLRDGDSCPGMVLIHGGRGTAFDEWVRLWNARGYAAIAVDLCGCVPMMPLPESGVKYQRHEYAGPAGWDASFDQMEWKTEDQWQFHAASDKMLAYGLALRCQIVGKPGQRVISFVFPTSVPAWRIHASTLVDPAFHLLAKLETMKMAFLERAHEVPLNAVTDLRRSTPKNNASVNPNSNRLPSSRRGGARIR